MKRYLLLAGMALSLLLFSCGLDNTMYNARKYFGQAQARPLNSNGKPSPQAVEEYTKTIQKCGMILTEKKEGKAAAEALFLLAKALYYKGNSAFQAKDQFEALISGFPQSRHVPEAYIYLARVLRQLNRAQDSEKLLESFVRDSRYQKHHPRALMVLAEFEIGDKDYLRAQYWLERIIQGYPKTPEYKEAFFLFGKNYYQQKEYQASYREFEKLLDTRGISKELKLEARYYMALDLFEMGELDRSLRTVNSLLNAESRPEKLSQVRVLKSRLLLKGDSSKKGIEEVDDIAKAYPRSASSAAAYYYLGDHYFYRQGDIANAITSYNKVRSEFPSSELVVSAQQKVNALNQISQNKTLNPKANLQQYVDYHVLAADNYLNAFGMADSTLLMYDRVLNAAVPMRIELDTLQISHVRLEAQADSLQQEIATLEALLPPEVKDTEDAKTETPKEAHEPATPSPQQIENNEQVTSKTDTQEPEEGQTPKPEADKNETQASKKPVQDDSISAILKKKRQTLSEVTLQQASLQTKIKELQGNLTRFDNEIIPLVSFAKASLLHKMLAPAGQIQEVLSSLERDYPDNKYTNALKMLIAGQKVRFVDPEEDRQAELLDRALGMYPAEADSMRNVLQELSQSTYPLIELKANFRLGWLYTFEEPDTTQAKAYLNAVLKHSDGGDYVTFTRKFYNGTIFQFPKDRPDSVAVIDSLLITPKTDDTETDDTNKAAGQSINPEQDKKSDNPDLKNQQPDSEKNGSSPIQEPGKAMQKPDSLPGLIPTESGFPPGDPELE